jgi:hypothetical protein
LAFVKDYLILPIDREKLKQLDFVDLKEIDNNCNNLHQLPVSASQSTNGQSLKEEEKGDGYKDYLNKFDTFISQSKLKLKSLESNTNLSEYQIVNNNNSRKSSNHNGGFNSAYEYEDENDDLFKLKNNNKNGSIGTNGADHSFDSHYSSSSASTNRLYNNANAAANSSSQPELVITSPNKYTNYYNSNHNLIDTSSRARLVRENLQRLEREKDDLYEL